MNLRKVKSGLVAVGVAAAVAVPAYAWDGSGSSTESSTGQTQTQTTQTTTQPTTAKKQHTNRGRHCGWSKKGRHLGTTQSGRGCAPRSEQSKKRSEKQDQQPATTGTTA